MADNSLPLDADAVVAAAAVKRHFCCTASPMRLAIVGDDLHLIAPNPGGNLRPTKYITSGSQPDVAMQSQYLSGTFSPYVALHYATVARDTPICTLDFAAADFTKDTSGFNTGYRGSDYMHLDDEVVFRDSAPLFKVDPAAATAVVFDLGGGNHYDLLLDNNDEFMPSHRAFIGTGLVHLGPQRLAQLIADSATYASPRPNAATYPNTRAAAHANDIGLHNFVLHGDAGQAPVTEAVVASLTNVEPVVMTPTGPKYHTRCCHIVRDRLEADEGFSVVSLTEAIRITGLLKRGGKCFYCGKKANDAPIGTVLSDVWQ